MSASRTTSGTQGPLLLCAWFAGGVLACSGSPGSGLDSLPPRTDFVDAGIESLHNPPSPASDAAVDAPPAPAPTSGAPLVGRSDNFSNGPDAGTGDAGIQELVPADAATGEATSSTAPIGASASCVVTFTVSGVFIDGILVQNVVLGGDVLGLGNWDPTLARNMAAASGKAGTWTLGVQLTDGQTVQFKFGMRASSQVMWETLSPDRPRALTVSCRDPEGLTYAGQFGLTPDGG